MGRQSKYKTEEEREAAMKAHRQRYYQEHKEELKEGVYRWREQHPERVAEYRAKEKTRYKEYKEEKRAYYQEHKEEKRAYQREWCKAHKEQVAEYQRRYRLKRALGKKKGEVNIAAAANLFRDPIQKAHFMWVIENNKKKKQE